MMIYAIHMGVPEMETFWNLLQSKVRSGRASTNEEILYRKRGKALCLLSNNPPHPGLQSHEITSLTARYETKVWESYLENNTPTAGRIFWAYGPEQGDIMILAIEPHPNDGKGNAYKRITLSRMGKDI